MTPTQEQIDEMVKRAKDVLLDYFSTGAAQNYSMKMLRESLAPFMEPRP